MGKRKDVPFGKKKAMERIFITHKTAKGGVSNTPKPMIGRKQSCENTWG